MACKIQFKGNTYTETEFNNKITTDPAFQQYVELHKAADLYLDLKLTDGMSSAAALTAVINKYNLNGSPANIQTEIDLILADGNVDVGPIRVTKPVRMGVLDKFKTMLNKLDQKLFNGIRSIKDSSGARVGSFLIDTIGRARGTINIEIKNASRNAIELTRASRGLSDVDKLTIGAMLKGSSTIDDLTITDTSKKNRINLIVTKMRAHIDKITQSFIDTGMIDSGAIDYYLDNQGKYVTRVYRSKLDPDGWWSKITSTSGKFTKEEQAAVNALTRAKDIYRNDILDRINNLSQNLANTQNPILVQRYTNMIEDLNDIISTDENLMEFIRKEIGTSQPTDIRAKGNELKGDFSIFKSRKDIPIEIRRLMGEITSPVEMYQATIKKMSHFRSAYVVSEKMANVGKDHLYKTSPDKVYSEEVNIKDFPALRGSPLFAGRDSIYVMKELAPFFKGSLDPKNKFIEAVASLNGWAKWGVTVASTKTQVRNFLSMPKFVLSNGNFIQVATAPNSLVTLGDLLKGGDFGRYVYEQGIRSGGISSSFTVTQFEALTKKGTALREAFDRVITLTAKNPLDYAKALAELLNKSYQFSDNVAKVFSVAVESEIEAKSRGYSSLQEAYELANSTGDFTDVIDIINEGSTNVRNTIPNYDETWRIVDAAKEIPLFGVFVAFPMEQIRNKVETIKIIKKELKSSNPTKRVSAMSRALGLILSGTITYHSGRIMTSYLRATLDDEEEKDFIDFNRNQEETFLKFYAPEWVKSAGLLVKPDGDFIMANPAAIDADGMFKDAINALDKLDDEGVSSNEVALEFLKPLLGSIFQPELGTKMINDIVTNDAGFGRKLSTNPDPFYNYMERVQKVFINEGLPGSAKDAMKIYKKSLDKIGKLEDQRDQKLESLQDYVKVSSFEDREKVYEEIHRLEKRIELEHKNRQALGLSQWQGIRTMYGNLHITASYKGFELKDKRADWKQLVENGQSDIAEQDYEVYVKNLKEQYWNTLKYMSVDVEKDFRNGGIPVKIMEYILEETDEIPELVFK